VIELKKQNRNIELAELTDSKIVIKGKKLKVRWLDSYLLIWSKEVNSYDE
jgi:hypothetical protein